MALSDIVNISISVESVRVERAGFGVPLILAPAADMPGGFTERVRFYSNALAVAEDFDEDGPTYKQALAFFSQEPKPVRLAIGRMTQNPTQAFKLTPVYTATTKYQFMVDGTLVEEETDGTVDTLAELLTAIKDAIDALALDPALTVTVVGGTHLTIVADTAGEHHSVVSLDLAKAKVEQNHADPSDLDDDMAAIALENNSWYAMLHAFNSKDTVEVIADFAEANEKLQIAAVGDSDIVALSDGSDTGGSQTIAGLAKASAYFRTALIYHPDAQEFADAAWAGKCLPLDPGSETWALKTLAGVEVVSLTGTQRTNALAKFVNVYELIAGVNVTNDGKVSGNEYIDVIRFRDWLRSEMAADVFAALVRAKKIPFTDGGISVIEGIVKARLQAGVDVGGLAADPAPKVSVPLASAVSGADKAARRLTGVKFDAVLAGAIQAVTVSGVLTV